MDKKVLHFTVFSSARFCADACMPMCEVKTPNIQRRKKFASSLKCTMYYNSNVMSFLFYVSAS